jgi:hypothetical protein
MQRLIAALLLIAQVCSHGTLNLPESRNGAQAGLGLKQGGWTQPYVVITLSSDCRFGSRYEGATRVLLRPTAL